jgi:hypothetical protein
LFNKEKIMGMYSIETILENCNVKPEEGPTGNEGIILTELAICQQKKLGRASIEAIHQAREDGPELDESHDLVVSMRAVHSTLRDWRMQRRKIRLYQDVGLDDVGRPLLPYGSTAYYQRYGYPRASDETVAGRNHI